MKMAKPSARDVKAAEELLQVLQLIDAHFGGPLANPAAGESLSELLKDGEEEFDSENERHLQTLYNNLVRLLRTAPSFHGRVISGMCHVIMYEKNQIIDPESDVIDLHPRFAQLQDRTTKLESLLLWALYHHQGGSSKVGQPIRRMLGIEQHAHLAPEQIDRAYRAACKAGCKTWLGHSGTGHIQCADCGRPLPEQHREGVHQ